MNNILEMIKNEKVEWKTLGDVKEIKTVSAKKKYKKQEYLDKGLYPIIDQGQDFIAGYTNDDNFLFDENSYVVFGDHTEAIKYVDFPFAQGADGIKVIKTCEEYINSKYLYHVLLNFYKITGDYKRHFSILKELEIPIPSMETQEKIVKILDTMGDHFTQLEAELEAELEARNKQYEYYRDKLLSEEYLNKLTKKYNSNYSNFELKEFTLGDVIKLKNGKDWKKLNEGIIPVYGSGGPMEVYVNKFSYNKETVLIPRKGSIDNVFYLDKPFWNVDTIYYTEVDTRILNIKFFYYFMKNIDLSSLSINPTRPSLTQGIINKIKIIIPPIPVQKHIVSILDSFNKIVTDINEGLPKEIELRQKQYEYYRERLLDFKREDE